MTTRSVLREVIDAANALREAQISLSIAVKAAYPPGTVVIAKLGGRRLIVRVTGYGNNGISPGDVIGVNVATGKRRRFLHSCIIEIVLWESGESRIQGALE